MGFINCLIQAAYTIAGPDYVAITAGEALHPRKTMPRAFNAVFYRLTGFFVLGSLAVGIVVPYNDPTLAAAFNDGRAGAAASPYVIAMDRLKIPVLPHIVNAMILTASFSAGNSYVYCSSRCLYGLALDGHAPAFFKKRTRTGVPIYCVLTALAVALLSFLQVSNSASVVLNWFVSLVTASQLINYTVVSITYLYFFRTLKAQGVARESLPVRGFWQPYTAWFSLACTSVMIFVSGYEVFLPGKWDLTTFVFSYAMVGVFPIVYIGWKLAKRPNAVGLAEKDTFEEERARVDRYEQKLEECEQSEIMRKDSRGIAQRVWGWLW